MTGRGFLLFLFALFIFFVLVYNPLPEHFRTRESFFQNSSFLSIYFLPWSGVSLFVAQRQSELENWPTNLKTGNKSMFMATVGVHFCEITSWVKKKKENISNRFVSMSSHCSFIEPVPPKTVLKGCKNVKSIHNSRQPKYILTCKNMLKILAYKNIFCKYLYPDIHDMVNETRRQAF